MMKSWVIKIPSMAWLLFGILTGFTLLSFNSYAQTEVVPAITLKESFLNNKSATLDESGQVTIISPGIAIKYAQSRLNLTLDYQFNAIINSGLQADDHENQSLNLLTQITHQPNHWDTQFNAGIERINTSPDGIQIIGDINDSLNSQELRTLGISTNYQNRLSTDIEYNTSLSIDYADIEKQGDTDSIALNLGIDNNRTENKLSWNVAISSRKSETSDVSDQFDDNQIDNLQAGLNYRINRKLSTFLAVDKSDTNNKNLNETSTTAGLFWVPNTNSSIKVGAGVRADDTTWSLDSMVKNRRLTLAVNYEEWVTSSRQLVFEETEFEPGLVTINQSLSITPVLLKKGTISLTATGRRTDFTLAYFNQSKNLKNINSKEEQIDGVSLTAKRTLSRFSSALLSISSQDSQTTQENTLNNIELSYIKQISKHINWSAEISKTEQTSDVPENEYEQALIGFSLSATF